MSLGCITVGTMTSCFNKLEYQNEVAELNQWTLSEKNYLIGLISSSISLGGIFGCLLVIPMLKYFTKRHCLMLSDLIAIFSTIFILWRAEFRNLFYGRLILGAYGGFNSTLVPIYSKELSPL